MKKKFFTSIAVTFVMAAALVAVAPTNAQAAKAINVKVGEKTTVKASKKVTWSIKDTSIATLNKKSGKKVKLTGVKEGSTILTTTDASGKKLDYAVNVKAAATAPAATNKLQEFANYVKSKNGLTYKGKVSAQNNYQKLFGNKWGWIYAGDIVLSDGVNYHVVYRPGVKNSEHDIEQLYTITADANNLYFRRTVKFKEMDWRYINTTNVVPGDPDTKTWSYPSWATGGLAKWDPKCFNENRYYIFGTTRDIENFTVTIPLNGGTVKAEFAHNFDYDFVKGCGNKFPNDFKSANWTWFDRWKAGQGTSGAVYSHWIYNFDKARYLTNAAYSWDVDKDQFDYLTNSVFWGSLNGYREELTGLEFGPNMSVMLSESLNSLLNHIDSIMKDNQTGFDLKSIGFDNFVNSEGHYFTNADAALAAVYTVAWQNIAFY